MFGKKNTRVLIADDEESFRHDFVNKHAHSDFEVEQVSDIYTLPHKLKDTANLPDLVVLDLYRTIASPDTPQSEIDNAEVDVLLAKIDADTTELKAVVNRVKTPAAIKILREIRSIPRLSKLPVLIYTRQGLTLLSDDEIRESIRLGAEWMMKGRSAGVERAQMNEFLRNAQQKRKRFERDLLLTIFGAFLGTIIGVIVQIIMKN
jgi:hypothetical protein